MAFAYCGRRWYGQAQADLVLVDHLVLLGTSQAALVPLASIWRTNSWTAGCGPGVVRWGRPQHERWRSNAVTGAVVLTGCGHQNVVWEDTPSNEDHVVRRFRRSTRPYRPS